MFFCFSLVLDTSFSTLFRNTPTLLWMTPYLGLDTPTGMEFLCVIGIVLSIILLVSQRCRGCLGYLMLWFLYYSMLPVSSVKSWFWQLEWDVYPIWKPYSIYDTAKKISFMIFLIGWPDIPPLSMVSEDWTVICVNLWRKDNNFLGKSKIKITLSYISPKMFIYIIQYLINLNFLRRLIFPRNFTCPSGKRWKESTSLAWKSTSPGLSDKTTFTHTETQYTVGRYCLLAYQLQGLLPNSQYCWLSKLV